MDNYNTFLHSPWYNDRDNIKTISIGDKVGNIGSYAFHGCKNLTALNISDSVTNIGESAFSVCRGLNGAPVIPDSVTSIGGDAFLRTGYSSLTLGDSVKTIGRYAFFDCHGFRGAPVIPDSVKKIDYAAFKNCDGFSSLTLGNSVESIGEQAFMYCRGLSGALNISDSVKSIGKDAFDGCYWFSSLTLGNSVTSDGMASLFKSSKLVSITLPGVNYAGTPSQSIPNSTFHENGAPIESPTWDAIKGKAWQGPGNGHYYTGNLTVTLDPNGGSVDPGSVTVAYGQTYGDLPSPTSGGKTFAGWFTEQSGGTQVKADTQVMYVDSQTLYAHWNRNLSENHSKQGARAPITFPFFFQTLIHLDGCDRIAWHIL